MDCRRRGCLQRQRGRPRLGRGPARRAAPDIAAEAGALADARLCGIYARARVRLSRDVAKLVRGASRMNFQQVSYDEALRRARDIVPTLRERAQKSEDARVLLAENEKLLHETGLFRYHQPKRFGGMELPFVAWVDIVAELACGCPSTAEHVGNPGRHHRI